MRNNLRRFISLIPIENDDKFYNIYHRNSSAKRKFDLLLKKPLSLEIANFHPETYLLNYTLEKNGKKSNLLPKIPKINIKFRQEEKLPSILTDIPTSNNSFIYHKPIEDEKSKLRRKISHKSSKLTINNIVFQEDKSNLSKSSSKQNIIFLERKKNIKELKRKIINHEFQKEMRQFKIYSKNMNEMIANQMVLEFLKRTTQLRRLKSDDLLLNYIISNNANKRYFKNRINTTESSNIENDEIINQKNSPSLIIHNVFFEWAISNVIQRYIDEINPLNKNASIKFIRNLLIEEIRNLSTLFFYKKKEKDEKDLPLNMRIVRNKFGKLKLRLDNKSENKRKKETIDAQLDTKREEIKKQLLEKIIEKITSHDEKQLLNNENNRRLMTKQNTNEILSNFEYNRELKKKLTSINNRYNNKINNDENNSNINSINNNNDSNNNKISNENDKKNIAAKINAQTNTDSSLNTSYDNNKNKIEKKDIKKKDKKKNEEDENENEYFENYG